MVQVPGADILAVDLATGDRTTLSGFSTGAGPSLIDPRGMARNGDGLFVTDLGFRAITAVDPRLGQRTIVAR